MDHLTKHIEALIFVAEPSISLAEIEACLDEQMGTKIDRKDIEQAIEVLIARYQSDDYAIEVLEISDGYRFMTKGAYYNTLATYLKQATKKRLSKAALETLSIIAYKQPVEKSELEKIRGVSCDYGIHKLLEKELIEISGRSEGPGRPLMYKTSSKFMDYFGLKEINDLPKLKDITTADSVIGEEVIEE